jgi:hypothetical protein
MKKLASRFKQIIRNQSGQGTAEYILLLVAVVALVFMFKGEISRAVKDKLGSLSSDISTFQGDKGDSN